MMLHTKHQICMPCGFLILLLLSTLTGPPFILVEQRWKRSLDNVIFLI